MVVVCLALLLEGMSTSGINVQIGAVHADLTLLPAELHLVPSAFLIAYAGLLPVAGSLADRLDRRRVFLLGIALFGVGCLVCAVAPGPWALVAGRFVQGAGAALSAPAALALITAGLPEGGARNRAVAIYGAMGAVGFSLGLVLPGAVVTTLGWRWSFAASVPAVLLVLAATWSVRSEPAQRGARPDLRGAAMLTAALMVALHLLGAFTTLSGAWLALEGGVLVALVARLVVRGGVRDLPRSVVGNPRVQSACLALGGLFAGVVASMYALSLAAHADGLDAIVVALLVVPQPVVFSLTAAAGARLVTARGPVVPFVAGGLLFAASVGWLAVVGLDAPAWFGVLPAMAGVGAALGLCFPAASVGAVDATPAHARATTAGVLTTAQNSGGALGIACLSALAVVPAAGSGIGVEQAMAWSGGLALAGLGAAALVLGTARRREATA